MNIKITCSLICLAMLAACSKFLDHKPSQSIAVPSTVEDIEAILNNSAIVNEGASLHELLADNYYTTTNDWQSLLSQSGRVEAYLDQCLNYIWDPGAVHKSWSNSYRYPIYYANVVLDLLREKTFGNPQRTNEIKGMALFYRAFAFERLTQIYCRPYGPESLHSPCIVLRNSADINLKPVRASVADSYARIIDDLTQAITLLPIAADFPTQPTKRAAHAALARLYLFMQAYDDAQKHAETCLSADPSLMDYNAYFPASRPVFPEFNEEVIFHAKASVETIVAPTRGKISMELYDLYDTRDLRKSLFFVANTGASAGTYSFQGSYVGRSNVAGHHVFHGLTNGELYLIAAECHARAGRADSAYYYLNELRKHRWKQANWQPLGEMNSQILLDFIFDERRRELVYRGLRWSDLRRLNEAGANITLSRTIDGKTYTLPPGDHRWVALIPHESVDLSGLEQNPR